MRKNTEELPIQRFYFSMSNLLHLVHIDDNLPSDTIRDLYNIVDNYYLESLSILRSSNKNEERISNEIDLKLKESRAALERLQRAREEIQDSSELEWVDVIQSRHISEREFKFKQIELEGEMNSLAAIVMFLSLLESTLYRITLKLIVTDSTLPEMQDVMKRSDNGIVKYLKYFERYIIKHEKPIIVGTKKYESIMFWLSIRNNIVHNNNLVKQDIIDTAKRLKINISINHYSNKFIFKNCDVMLVANLSGEILHDCIERGLYRYFYIEGEN